jgi:hypothetical protein
METLKRENQELKGQFDAQGAQFVEIERQIMQLQQAYGLALLDFLIKIETMISRPSTFLPFISLIDLF